MKRSLFAIILFSTILTLGFAQNTTKQNDVIISEAKNKSGTTTRYTHQQSFGGFEKDYIAYDIPGENKSLFTVPAYSYLKIQEIEVQKKNELETIWYKIEYNNQTGWIQVDFNPYKNENWTLLGTEAGKDKTFNIRKMEIKLLTSPDKESPVVLYEKPDFSSKVITTINEEVPVNTFAITEESEAIQWGKRKKSEYWVKISYNGQEGWIFGAYLDSGKGGPKYPIPENIISWNLEAGGV